MTTAVIIFIITYLGIIFTRLPWVNIDRPSAAFFGAVAMVVFGVLSPEEALHAIDFNTIALLLGMMIIIAVMQLDGFFKVLATKTMGIAGNQRRLLFIIVFVTGISSAFMVNDVVVLMFTPMVIMICRSANRNPIPYLIAVILSSNIGSVMTITGNPQNMLIGVSSDISYGRFLLILSAVAIPGLLLMIPVIRLMYPSEFSIKAEIVYQENPIDVERHKTRLSIPVFVLVIAGFFTGKTLGLSIPLIALCGASIIMLLGNVKPSKVIKEVDWVLLLFFSGLFVVVDGFVRSGAMSGLFEASPLQADMKSVVALHGVSLIASQVVSNVPFTIAILPLMQHAGSEMLWISLASAATLAGNATIIGAVANLIVIESASRNNIKISFFEFLKPGILVTAISLIWSIAVIFIWHSIAGLLY